MDAVIDGACVDVKSASSFAFAKFKDNKLLSDDPFGYIPQVSSYLHANRTNPNVHNHKEIFFLVINKESGELCLDKYEVPDLNFADLAEWKKNMVKTKRPPNRSFEPEPQGKSGNLVLSTYCRYCEFKGTCWEGLRGFEYSRGPVYLVEVKEPPKVPEFNVWPNFKGRNPIG